MRKRLLSFGLILAIGMLMLTSLVVSATISYLGGMLSGGGDAIARALEMAGSIAVMTALFAMTFKILPSRPIPWKDVLLGSLVTALLFTVGKYLIGLYIGKSAVASDFGAELTREYSLAQGARAAPGKPIDRRKGPRLADMNAGYEELLERAKKLAGLGPASGTDPVR